jgi:putative transposase
VKKNYQKNATGATTPVLPEAVSVVMAELAGDVQEGLLAMAVGTGLQVMAAMMNADVEAVRAEGSPRPGPQRGATRRRRRVGHAGRQAGAGDPAADARRRWDRGAAGGLV